MKRWLTFDGAQDSYEYLLAIALVAVPIAAALIYGLSLLVPELIEFACPTVDSGGVGGCF